MNVDRAQLTDDEEGSIIWTYRRGGGAQYTQWVGVPGREYIRGAWTTEDVYNFRGIRVEGNPALGVDPGQLTLTFNGDQCIFTAPASQMQDEMTLTCEP